MNLLSTNDRDYVLNQLRTAPDHILVDAMLALNDLRTKTMKVRGVCEELLTATAVGVGPAASDAEKTVTAEPRRNLNPGAATISKIGSNTKDVIFEFLRDDKQPPAKYDDHLKLLWARGEVKYDGKEWYV